MSNNVLLSGSISISSANTPTRDGLRIASISDIENIPAPFIGEVIYVEDSDYFIYVKSLKSKKIGNFEIKNALVDEYKLFSSSESNLIWNEVL